MGTPANDNIPVMCLYCRTILWFYAILLFCLLVTYPSVGLADIQFKEVTKEAGINHAGTSFGASWGDFNGDGWPDLWVSNHDSKPTLYLNRQNGTFENIIDKVWSGDPTADTHGAAWADFDNDGDQDLIELVDVSRNEDGTLCIGCGKNHLYINENGQMWQRAADFGLDQQGQGRSPQWFDADRDGLLDLLVANTRGSSVTSNIFLQDKNHQFRFANKALRFKDARMDRKERIWGRLENLIRFDFKRVKSVFILNAIRGLESAQLANLSSNGHADLILFSQPTRVFEIDSTPFKDVTNQVGLPNLSRIKDTAIADFNGDLRMDLFVVEGVWLPSDVIRTSPSEIEGTINWAGSGPPKSVSFIAEGDLHFQIYPTWLPLAKVFIGSTNRHPENREFILSPLESEVHGPADAMVEKLEGVLITYDPNLRTWTIRNYNKSVFVDFIAKATQKISSFQTTGFKPFKPEGKGVLFLQQKNGFVKEQPVGEAGENIACISVAAGDFDNDMDMDLYMACKGPIKNLPNRLLENDGKGGFQIVPGAAGAAGSDLGRSDVVVTADYDRDGFLDLFVTNGADPTSPFVADGPHQLFQNIGNSNHWLEIDLEGVISNRDGIGSRVELETGDGTIQIREQTGGMHRIAQNHQRLHFGLGSHKMVKRLTVTWPNGVTQSLKSIDADQILRITEPH